MFHGLRLNTQLVYMSSDIVIQEDDDVLVGVDLLRLKLQTLSILVS
jgi:hypothetical protein